MASGYVVSRRPWRTKQGSGIGRMGKTEVRTDRVAATELEAETIDLTPVDRVVVQDTNVHLPFFQIVRRGDADAGREVFVDLGEVSIVGGSVGR